MKKYLSLILALIGLPAMAQVSAEYPVAPYSLIGKGYDPLNVGGDALPASGSYTALFGTPYSTVSGSNVVTITLLGQGTAQPTYAATPGTDQVYIPTSCTLNGTTVSAGLHTIVSAPLAMPGVITVTGTGNANATGNGCGSVGYILFPKNSPDAVVAITGEWHYGIKSTNALFDTDEIYLPGFVVDPAGNVTANTITCTGGCGASAAPFSGITSGTNTTATMTVGSGGSITTSGTGTVTATSVGATIYASTYGVVCDSVTDNTTALGNAITAAESSAAFGAVTKLVLPSGGGSGKRCISGSQTITGQIWIEGESGPSGSVLSLKSGSTTALFTITPSALTGGTIPPQPLILFTNFRITSEDGNGITGSSGNYTCGATNTNAHGIAFTNTANSMWARMDNLVIYNMPGDGVYSSNFNGFVEWYKTYIVQNGQYGVSETADNDWQWDEPEVASNCLDNMLWSGVSSNFMSNANLYNSYTGRGLYIFGNTDVQIVGGEFNNNFLHGMQVGNLNAADVISIWGTRFKSNSLANAGNADDIYISCNASCTSNTYGGKISAGHLVFQTPGSGSPTLNNVGFSSPTTYLATYNCVDCTYPSTGTVSNQLSLLNVTPITAPPSAGQILVGNAGGTAYASATVSGDGSLASTGALTINKTGGTSFGPLATQASGTGSLAVFIPSGCQSGTAVTHTGTTTEFNLATCTIPANTMGANGALRVTVFFQTTNNADTKTLTIRHNTTSGATTGGTNFSSTSATTSANTTVAMILRNANATNSQIAFNNGTSLTGSTTTAPTTGAIDTTAVSYININCADTTSSADTCGTYGYTVEVLP